MRLSCGAVLYLSDASCWYDVHRTACDGNCSYDGTLVQRAFDKFFSHFTVRVDPDQMLGSATSDLGLHCLPKSPFI